MAYHACDLRQVEFLQADAERNQYAFRGLARRHFENAVLLQSKVVGVSQFKRIEQFVKDGGIALIFLLDLRCAYHLHDHREVLFFGRGFVDKIEDKRLQQCRFCSLPERIIGLCALGCGVPHKVGNELQNVLIVTQIYKRVIPVAALGVDKVKHPYLIAFLFEHKARITEYLAFRVEDNE